MFRTSSWNPVLAIGLLNVHLSALAAVLLFPPRLLDLSVAFASFLWFGFASSFYYHRYLTHRGFELAKPLQWLFLAGGLVGLSGDPVRWVCTHRYHHQHPDGHADLHSPNDGWLYAHMGWLAKLDLDWVDSIRPLAADLRRIWWLRIWENPVIAVVPHFIMAGALYAYGGLGLVAWGLYVPLVGSFHFGWMSIASFCHLPQFGSRASETPDQSRNIAWLGPFTFGESFHNHHHAYPRRAKHGLHWWEIDASKYLLWAMERTGLAWNVVWDYPSRLGSSAAATVAAAEPSWDAPVVMEAMFEEPLIGRPL